MLFYRFRKKTPITGHDKKGELFDIMIVKGEEVSEETFEELSDGTGGDKGYLENKDEQ